MKKIWKMHHFLNPLNKHFLPNILQTAFKFDMLILDAMMEGTISQILCLGPRFYSVKSPLL